jgi:hypothetical protein
MEKRKAKKQRPRRECSAGEYVASVQLGRLTVGRGGAGFRLAWRLQGDVETRISRQYSIYYPSAMHRAHRATQNVLAIGPGATSTRRNGLPEEHHSRIKETQSDTLKALSNEGLPDLLHSAAAPDSGFRQNRLVGQRELAPR